MRTVMLGGGQGSRVRQRAGSHEALAKMFRDLVEGAPPASMAFARSGPVLNRTGRQVVVVEKTTTAWGGTRLTRRS